VRRGSSSSVRKIKYELTAHQGISFEPVKCSEISEEEAVGIVAVVDPAEIEAAETAVVDIVEGAGFVEGEVRHDIVRVID
jgi:hypothetical protein